MKKPFSMFLLFAVVTILSTLYFCVFMTEPADTVFINARIHTMDSRGSSAEAIAVRGGRIVAVGSRASLELRFHAAESVDLQGRTVLPGFIDAHAHLLSLGLARLTVDLVGAASEEEAAGRVRERVERSVPNQWIRGRGWDQNDWTVKQFPSRISLDRVAPKNPVCLARVDGHAAWTNSRALELAGISRTTPDPAGGKIVHAPNGEPTGLLVDAAMDLVYRVLPQPSDGEMQEAVRLAIEDCIAVGITGVHDMGVDQRTLEMYRAMIDEDRFPLRVYALVDGPGETWERVRRQGPMVDYGGQRLTVRGLKLYVDGALGSRGAAMVEPYSDDPVNRGLTVTNEETLRDVVAQAVDAGFQVCTHAIGDRGNNIALNAYESVLRSRPALDRRLRVEHAQILLPEDVGRFKTLGVIPSMQPAHCTSDMYWAEARVGPKRIHGAYAWRSLLATGVVIPGGSDFPVEPPNPLLGISAAVTRRDPKGIPATQADIDAWFQLAPESVPDPARFTGGWYGDERMTVEEAIRSFTTWAAYGAFEEGSKGSIEPGKLADFVVLSGDPFAAAPGDLSKLSVLRTVLGGRTVYER